MSRIRERERESEFEISQTDRYTRIKLSSSINTDEKIADKKTRTARMQRHCASCAECYPGFYYACTFIVPSLFYNDPLGFENYFPFCLSAEAKCPFQFTFRQRVFTPDKAIRGIFPRFSLLVSYSAERNPRKCKRHVRKYLITISDLT